MMRLIKLVCLVLVAGSLAGCDRVAQIVGSNCSSVPAVSNPKLAVGPIEIGMSAKDALTALDCLEGDPDVSQGTAGQYAKDINTLLTELKEGSYANYFLATVGEKRDCNTSASTNSSLSSDLAFDDLRFGDQVAKGNGFTCYATIREQISVRLGGAPGQERVVGVWRLNIPEQGDRPQLSAWAYGLAERYPALAEGSEVTSGGFQRAAFLDNKGNKLNVADLAAARTMSVPVEPAALETTESCGFLWLNTCTRNIPAEEQQAYDQKLQAYRTESAEYERLRELLENYGACITTPPLNPLDPTLAEDADTNCGISYFATAKTISADFIEASFVGIYDASLATRLRKELSNFVKTKRPIIANVGGQKSPDF